MGAGCAWWSCVVLVEHADYSAILALALSEGSYAAADRVNGVVHEAVFEVTWCSGVCASVTYVLFDGHNTNLGRGSIYTDDSAVVAWEWGVDAGTVYDGDVDCRSVADV